MERIRTPHFSGFSAHKRTSRHHGRLVKQVEELRKQNLMILNSFKSYVEKSTVVFRFLIDEKSKSGESIPLSTPRLVSSGFSSYPGSFLSDGSQSTQAMFDEGKNVKTRPVERALKDLESIACVLERAKISAEARRVLSSGSETAYDSDYVTPSRVTRKRPVEEIWIHSSDDEPEVVGVHNRNRNVEATNEKTTSPAPQEPKPTSSQLQLSLTGFGKVSKSKTGRIPNVGKEKESPTVKDEDFAPLDLTQRIPDQSGTAPGVNTEAEDTAVKSVEKSRVPCPKCGKLYVSKGLQAHVSRSHDYACRHASCGMSFISAKQLRDHKSVHEKGSISKFLK